MDEIFGRLVAVRLDYLLFSKLFLFLRGMLAAVNVTCLFLQ